jgi:hypothetical protein
MFSQTTIAGASLAKAKAAVAPGYPLVGALGTRCAALRLAGAFPMQTPEQLIKKRPEPKFQPFFQATRTITR